MDDIDYLLACFGYEFEFTDVRSNKVISTFLGLVLGKKDEFVQEYNKSIVAKEQQKCIRFTKALIEMIPDEFFEKCCYPCHYPLIYEVLTRIENIRGEEFYNYLIDAIMFRTNTQIGCIKGQNLLILGLGVGVSSGVLKKCIALSDEASLRHAGQFVEKNSRLLANKYTVKGIGLILKLIDIQSRHVGSVKKFEESEEVSKALEQLSMFATPPGPASKEDRDLQPPEPPPRAHRPVMLPVPPPRACRPIMSPTPGVAAPDKLRKARGVKVLPSLPPALPKLDY